MEDVVGVLFLMFWVVGCLLGTAFWIWMLIDCARYERRKGNDRIAWILIIALTHFIGALIYFFGRRPERMREQSG